MNRKALVSALVLIMALPLAACGQSSSQDAPTAQQEGLIAGKVRKEIEEARKKLETENIRIGRDGVNFNSASKRDEGRPKAEITPSGQLLIEGKPVAATPEQTALLLDYRRQVIAVASSAMDMGIQAADVGTDAAKTALLAIFSGADEDEIEKRMKAKVAPIEQAAKQLCQQHMPALLATQQQLAAAMPEFVPYATMTQKDVEECNDDNDEQDTP
jgi:hypothetical protein